MKKKTAAPLLLPPFPAKSCHIHERMNVIQEVVTYLKKNSGI